MEFTLMLTLILILSSSLASGYEKEESPAAIKVKLSDKQSEFRVVQNDFDGSEFFEPSQIYVADGNRPDDRELITHEHVDRTVGQAPPTKRVKKILPPFERKKRTKANLATKFPLEVNALKMQLGTDARPPTQGAQLEGVARQESELEHGESHQQINFDNVTDGRTYYEQQEKTIWEMLKQRRVTESEVRQNWVRPNDSKTESGKFGAKNQRTKASLDSGKKLFDRFDEDSEEMEQEMRNFEGQPRKESERGSTLKKSVRNDGDEDAEVRASKRYLILLTGNTTIVKLREKDFAKYLKLNLAARLSVQYDDVKVNDVMLGHPEVLVNVSVYAPSEDVAEESELEATTSDEGEAALHELLEKNATLLELSGEEFKVVRFFSFETESPDAEARKHFQKSTGNSKQRDLRLITYAFIGSGCACGALLASFIAVKKCYGKVTNFRRPEIESPERENSVKRNAGARANRTSPAVIFSTGLPRCEDTWISKRCHEPGRSTTFFAPSRNESQNLESRNPSQKNKARYELRIRESTAAETKIVTREKTSPVHICSSNLSVREDGERNGKCFLLPNSNAFL